MNILIVDDEITIRANLGRLLKLEGHLVFEAEDGMKAIAAMTECLPDLVFTDVRMPNMDGYELCRAIKAHDEFKIAPVIFVSGVESIEARIEAFMAGGEDFIVKPFQIPEVLRKVSSAARIFAEAKGLREQAETAQSTAFVAMKWAAEIGIVLEFLRGSLACSNQGELAHQLRNAAAQFGLDATVHVRGRDHAFCLSGRGRDIPLDLSVMNHVRLQGRIFEFQNRSAFNYDSVTILISNMPREDQERCGRLRDHLALLAEAADARNRALELEEHKRSQSIGVSAALAAAESAVRTVSNGQRLNQDHIESGMVRLQENLARVFVGCGLRESQERSIVAVVEEHIEETAKLLSINREAATELDRVTSILAGLAQGGQSSA